MKVWQRITMHAGHAAAGDGVAYCEMYPWGPRLQLKLGHTQKTL